jgi:hypothetical protein
MGFPLLGVVKSLIAVEDVEETLVTPSGKGETMSGWNAVSAVTVGQDISSSRLACHLSADRHRGGRR